MRTEDGYIIQQCLDGDSMAFGLLVDKYKRSIYALAFSRVHNFHDAQDITQEVFIKAYRNLRSLKRWDNFLGWLYRITCNQCNDWIRSGSKRPDHDYIEDQEPSNLDNISLDFYNTDMTYNTIRESLESLPEVYREVLSLRYFGGMNVMEISKLLGISTRTIDRRLNEAMSRLKEETLAMIGTAREQHELPSAFTFRVVEIIKHIRVNPMSPLKALPLGITLAIGIIGGLLSIGAHLNPTELIGSFTSSISESKVLDVGEFPVNVLKVSKTPIISNQKMNGDGLGSVVPSLQNALFMAPQAEGGIWTKKSDMPTNRVSLTSAKIGDIIYCMSGSTFNDSCRKTEAYNPLNNTWEIKADMAVAVYGITTTELNGKIYALGDIPDGLNPTSTIQVYDPINDKWTRLKDMPIKLAAHSAVALNGKIYIMGGYQVNNIFKNEVWTFDPINEVWEQKNNLPVRLIYASACVVNGKIYLFGGEETLFKPSNKVFEYDPQKDQWIQKSDMPNAKVGAGITVIQGKIYIVGGHQLDNTTSDNIDIYDPAQDKWIEQIKMTSGRSFSAVESVNNKLYVIGGSHFCSGWGWNLGNDPKDTLNITEEYDTGFRPSQAIESKGKLPTKWGQRK
jgi:RNA polymerase sigma factor (sigma-70 family)